MYTRAQKESSSTSPTSSIHKKSNNSDSSHSFSVQRQPEINSSQEKERPRYSRKAADLLAANVMRSMAARQQGEEAQGAASVTQVVMPKLELPIAPVASVFRPSGEMGIQRQCSACEQAMEDGKDSDEMSSVAGVQRQLTVGAPGDRYEQEADRVAAQVMRMSIPPDHSPQVQRFGEEDNPVQRWSLAQSITPVVHRRVDEQVQMHQLVQRAFQAGGNQASGDLESRLNASKGGGSALAPEVRAFMEPRFGADFSGVRVHTGSEAVQMNRELGAQAFAHGSDVYFGAGKSPGNNELTAHELTHVVQQTGGVQTRQISEQQTVQPVSADVIQRAVTIDSTSLTTFSDIAAWYAQRLIKLLSQQSEMSTDNVPAPVSVQDAITVGRQNAQACQAKGDTEIDSGAALQAQIWFDYKYVKAMNEAEAEKAKVAAKRMDEIHKQVQAAQDQLDNVIIPTLRDKQRASFRKDDENALLGIADTVATALDTSLVTKDTILAIRAEAAELENMANVAKGYKGVIPSANSKAPVILECAEKVNKVYAAFQLVRAGLDLIGSKKTASGGAKAGVKAMSTVVSAGGTLLGASAGMTLYANLYLGPAVDACLAGISKLEDLLSKGRNRQLIELGEFDAVNWSIEPGAPDGRPVFNFMLAVMKASDQSGVPNPVPATVANYFVDNEDSFNAGVGGNKKMPTKGFWFLEEVDQTKITQWVFRNRANLWGMLYGAATPPV